MAALVSILIPVYNAAPWLAATVESALAQTHPHCELILIDDGSRDDSLSLAQRYASDRVRVYSQKNSGASSARNHALRHARGDFIQYLDADDLLAPDKISLQLARLNSAPANSVASCKWTRFSGSPPAAHLPLPPQPTWRDLSGLDFLRLHYDGHWMMPPITWLTPRTLVEAVGPWREDLTLNDDGEFFCRVLLRATGICFTPGARAYYRSGVPGSLSRRNDQHSLRSLYKTIEANTAALLAHDNSPATRRSVANAWIRLAHELFPTLPAEATSAEQQSRAHGGSNLRIAGGRLIRLTDRILGWRAAARLKQSLA